MGHKSRAQRQRQRLRSAERLAKMFGPGRESSEESSTERSSSGPRTLSFAVRGGWSMDFHFSGVAVPVDFDQEPEHQHLREKTLAEMMRRAWPDEGEEA